MLFFARMISERMSVSSRLIHGPSRNGSRSPETIAASEICSITSETSENDPITDIASSLVSSFSDSAMSCTTRSTNLKRSATGRFRITPNRSSACLPVAMHELYHGHSSGDVNVDWPRGSLDRDQELTNLTNSGARVTLVLMGDRINIYDAKARLSELVDRAAAGEEIIIAKAGKPRARLVPLQPPKQKPRKPGGGKGRGWVAEDFDAPLPPEILAAFEGSRR